jgi:hypothetical protein
MASRLSNDVTTSRDRNVFGLLCVLSTMGMSMEAETIVADAREIMKQSLAAGELNSERLRGYVWESRISEKQIDADGTVRSEVVKGYQTLVIEGVMVRKLMSKNDRPLQGDEARKEEERVRKIVADRKNESVSAKRSRVEERGKKRAREREFRREILDGFIFKTLGEETVAGRKNWVIEATPRPGFEPREMRAKIFPHLKGKIWIDQQDKMWTKADAIGIDPLTVGFGIIAKLEQGAHFYFEQARMEDGTWVLRQSGLRAIAHIAMMKRIAIDRISTFKDYRKVPAGVEVYESTGR